MTPRPKESTREKTLENRQAILESAETAFAAKGFDGANMREIASKAGVNKFMLYYHFEDKQTLFEHVLNSMLTPIFKRVFGVIGPAADLEEAVANVYQVYADLFKARGERLRSFMAREIAAGAPRAKVLFKAFAPEIASLWGPKLEARAGRTLGDVELAMLIVSIMTGIVSTFLMEPLFSVFLDKVNIDITSEKLKQHVVADVIGGVDRCLTMHGE